MGATEKALFGHLCDVWINHHDLIIKDEHLCPLHSEYFVIYCALSIIFLNR